MRNEKWREEKRSREKKWCAFYSSFYHAHNMDVCRCDVPSFISLKGDQHCMSIWDAFSDQRSAFITQKSHKNDLIFPSLFLFQFNDHKTMTIASGDTRNFSPFFHVRTHESHTFSHTAYFLSLVSSMMKWRRERKKWKKSQLSPFVSYYHWNTVEPGKSDQRNSLQQSDF